jgi:hypothetical protein
LIALLPWLGFSMAQRQAAGPLHRHQALPDRAGVVQQALEWWMGQVRAQVQAGRHARAHATGHVHGHVHSNESGERHHHALGDTSVQALELDDGAGQTQAGGSLLPLLASPSAASHMLPMALSAVAWPWDAAARFRSWSTAPPRRPPRA